MSGVLDILVSRVDVKRFTAQVLDKTAVQSALSPSRQPVKASRLQVIIEGCTVGTGLVSVTGSTVEQIPVTQNGEVVGNLDFTSISGITLSGISAGFVTVKAVSPMGEPINQQYLLASGVSCRFFEKNSHQPEHKAGQEQRSKKMGTGVMFEPSRDVVVGDWLYSVGGIIGQTLSQVIAVDQIYDFNGDAHHLECWLTQI